MASATNIFKYLEEEQELIQDKLANLVRDFRQSTREQNFDEVKLICDRLRAYCKKQLDLLLDKIQDRTRCQAELEETNRKRASILDDLNELVMIHVDEPGYDDYLVKLLNHTESFFQTSKTLYDTLSRTVSSQVPGKIDADLQEVIHSDVGFNELPAS